jgi:hypothetical protein
MFLQETRRVARPKLPFADLKRWLLRRCAAMRVAIKEVWFFPWLIDIGAQFSVSAVEFAWGCF